MRQSQNFSYKPSSPLVRILGGVLTLAHMVVVEHFLRQGRGVDEAKILVKALKHPSV